MAYLKDEEQNSAIPLSAPAVPGGGAAPMGAPSAKPAGSGFVNLQQVLGLNAGQGAKMADAIASPVESAARGVQSAADAYGDDYQRGNGSDFQGFAPERYAAIQGQSADTSARARALGSFGGREALLAEKYGHAGSGYSAGQQGMDAFLAGAEGGQRLNAAASQYGNLDRALGLSAETHQRHDAAPTSGLGNAANPYGVPIGGPVAAPGFRATPTRIARPSRNRSPYGGF